MEGRFLNRNALLPRSYATAAINALPLANYLGVSSGAAHCARQQQPGEPHSKQRSASGFGDGNGTGTCSFADNKRECVGIAYTSPCPYIGARRRAECRQRLVEPCRGAR